MEKDLVAIDGVLSEGGICFGNATRRSTRASIFALSQLTISALLIAKDETSTAIIAWAGKGYISKQANSCIVFLQTAVKLTETV